MTPRAQVVGPFPVGADPVEYDRRRRRVLWKMPTGLYLLGSRAGARRNLMTCSLAVQLATEPKLLGVAVESGSVTLGLVREGRSFALSLLSRQDRALVRTFAKPAEHDASARTLSGVAYLDAPATGCPAPASAVAVLDCRLERVVELGSHALLVGEVLDAVFGDEGEEAEVLRIEDTRVSYGG